MSETRSSPAPVPRFTTAQIAILCVSLVLLAGIGAAVFAWTGVTSAMRPKITVTTAVAATVGELKRESKLVVLSLPISITIHKSSTKEPLWGILPQGTAEVLMLVPDNRVQYVLNMESVSAENFEYDSSNHKLIFHAPLPMLDEEMVAIQPDPAKIKIMTNTGWLRTDIFSGEPLRSSARQEVKKHVLAEARKPHYRDIASEVAELHLRKLLGPMMRTVDGDVKLEIKFKQATSTPEVAP